MLKIVKAASKEEIEHIRGLFVEYADSLDFDLDFQDFETEFAELPGEYAPPEGRLLLCWHESQLAGCAALRKITREICEMKRLYARSSFRGRGIGKALCLAVIEESREIGYLRMRLDTIPSMHAATAIYYSLGFKEIKPYRYNPIEGALFLELKL